MLIEESEKELINTPKNDGMIYDVGMHKGEDTALYLCKGFRVIGIEADPELVEICRKRFINEINSGQLKIIQGAIVEEAQIDDQREVVFYKNLKNSAWGTIQNSWNQRNLRNRCPSKVIKVRKCSFKDILCEYGIPYYLKIDIEGADMICVNILNQFTNKPSYISIESNKTSIFKIIKELRILNKLGYNRFQAVQQSANHIKVAPIPAREGKSIAISLEKHSSGLFGRELTSFWKNLPIAILHYSTIRIRYIMFGEEGLLFILFGRRYRTYFNKLTYYITPVEIPGWYDTHARHSSVK